jgi:hypothetical protein
VIIPVIAALVFTAIIIIRINQTSVEPTSGSPTITRPPRSLSHKEQRKYKKIIDQKLKTSSAEDSTTVVKFNRDLKEIQQQNIKELKNAAKEAAKKVSTYNSCTKLIALSVLRQKTVTPQ